jgi:hypothetical protein
MSKKVTLKWYESADIGDAKVTFAGSAPVHYGPSMPPDGSLLFDVTKGGESERLTLVGESDFARVNDALGVTIKVLSPYALKLTEVEVELGEVAE